MTNLKGKKPEAIQKRLKALFYGSAGVGKTMAAIQFPKPYLIDTERGAENSQYIKLLEKQGGVIFQTDNFDDIINEVKTLLTIKHEYKTLIIDPLTIVYNNMLDQAAIKVGTDFGRHYGEVNKHMKRLLNLLIRLDMNVIITSHAKNEYGTNLSILGQTFDCYKKIDYLFDLTLEINKFAGKRIATIQKSRIEAFEETDKFEFSYDSLAEKYGKELLEKDVKNHELATKEQISQLTNLVEQMHIADDVTAKWLDKAQSSSFEEMEKEKIQACINFLLEKIQKIEDIKQ